MEASNHITMMTIDGLYHVMITALYEGGQYSAAFAGHASEQMPVIVYKHCFQGACLIQESRNVELY